MSIKTKLNSNRDNLSVIDSSHKGGETLPDKNIKGNTKSINDSFTSKIKSEAPQNNLKIDLTTKNILNLGLRFGNLEKTTL